MRVCLAAWIGRVVAEGSGVREQACLHDMTRGMLHAGERVGRRRRPVGLGHAELVRVWGGDGGGRRHGRRGHGALGPHRYGSLSLPFHLPVSPCARATKSPCVTKSLPARIPCMQDTPMSFAYACAPRYLSSAFPYLAIVGQWRGRRPICRLRPAAWQPGSRRSARQHGLLGSVAERHA